MEVIKAKPLQERKRPAANVNQIPIEITQNVVLNNKISGTLPANYNFELHKTIWRIKCGEHKRVALQFPEGLFVFAVAIADILEEFACVEVLMMGDVTYGACCVDDYTADDLQCDLIIHYAHSCLVPVNQMINGIKVLYIFVDIKIDLWHLVETIKSNFSPESRIALASTIQFVQSIHSAAKELRSKHGFNITIPQSKPLSPGEVLGCTSAKLPKDIDLILFVSDGRFHLESMMIANPNLKAFKYNPYNKELTREEYHYQDMIALRQTAIQVSSQACNNDGTIGFILGTLGRQGNPTVLRNLHNNLKKSGKCQFVNFLLPEIKPHVLNLFHGIDTWVQIACPRLSIDWGNNFTTKPLLTPYEFNVAIKKLPQIGSYGENVSEYPMDFYSSTSLGNWTPSHKCNDNCVCNK